MDANHPLAVAVSVGAADDPLSRPATPPPPVVVDAGADPLSSSSTTVAPPPPPAAIVHGPLLPPLVLAAADRIRGRTAELVASPTASSSPIPAADTADNDDNDEGNNDSDGDSGRARRVLELTLANQSLELRNLLELHPSLPTSAPHPASKLTPLHLAASRGFDGVVQVLVDAGAVVDARDPERETPLHKACFKGNTWVVDKLIAAKADVNARDRHGWTPLHVAVARNHRDVVDALLRRPNIDINAVNNAGVSPLMITATHSHLALMRTLLSHHAATMLATQQGETAYDLAVLHSHALAAAILARADPRLVKHTRLRCVIEVSNRPDPESAFDSTPTRVPTAVSSSIQSASTIASNPIAASGLGILTGLVRGRSATAPSTTTATTNDGEFLELDPTGHSPRPHLWTSLEAVPALPNWAWVTDWRLLDSQWAQVPAAASPTTIEAARPHNIDDAAAAGYSASMPDPSSLAWSAGARRGQRTMAGGSYMDRQASLSVIDHGQTAIAAVMGGGSDALEHPSPPAAHSPLHASRHHHTDESGDHPHSVALAMGVGQPGQYVRAWARVMRKIAPSPVPAHGLLGQMAESSLAASHPQEQQESAAPSTTSMTEQPAVPPSADLDYLDRAVAILDRSDPAYADISDFELYQVAIQCLLAGAQEERDPARRKHAKFLLAQWLDTAESLAHRAASPPMSGSPTSDGESPTAAIPRSPQPWVPDAQAPACHHCHKRFSWTVRRHHCRLCGNVVCGSCSRHRVDLTELLPGVRLGPRMQGLVRICTGCHGLLGPQQQQQQQGRRSESFSGAAAMPGGPMRSPPASSSALPPHIVSTLSRTNSIASIVSSTGSIGSLVECPGCGASMRSVGARPADREAHIAQCLVRGSSAVARGAAERYTADVWQGSARASAAAAAAAAIAGASSTRESVSPLVDPMSECLICYEQFDVGDRVVRMGCMCCFHAHCATSWFNKHKAVECPMHIVPKSAAPSSDEEDDDDDED